MSLISRLIGWAASLAPADTYDVAIERHIPVPMPDGVVLLADHYYPRRGKPPTILVRSPYGRAGTWGMFFARPFAERGFQVLIQSCRGTFGSGGKFDAFCNERADGLATLAGFISRPGFRESWPPSGRVTWALFSGQSLPRQAQS